MTVITVITVSVPVIKSSSTIVSYHIIMTIVWYKKIKAVLLEIVTVSLV